MKVTNRSVRFALKTMMEDGVITEGEHESLLVRLEELETDGEISQEDLEAVVGSETAQNMVDEAQEHRNGVRELTELLCMQ